MHGGNLDLASRKHFNMLLTSMRCGGYRSLAPAANSTSVVAHAHAPR